MVLAVKGSRNSAPLRALDCSGPSGEILVWGMDSSAKLRSSTYSAQRRQRTRPQLSSDTGGNHISKEHPISSDQFPNPPINLQPLPDSRACRTMNSLDPLLRNFDQAG